ncbi:MAG: hypothetical protein EOO41_03630, partial [Methanobacteriota archaeon]
RLEGMVADGHWLPALALALDHFHKTNAAHLANIQAAEMRRRWAATRAAMAADLAAQQGVLKAVAGGAGSGGRTGAPTPGAAIYAQMYNPAQFERQRQEPGPTSRTTPLGSELERLVKRYISAVVEKAPPTMPRQHFAMAASSAMEYCVTIGRVDVLMQDVFSAFEAVKKEDVFAEELEPFVTAGKVSTMEPAVLKAFVEHFRSTGQLDVVERCLLRLNLASLDVDSAVRTCLGHRLYSAFVYIVTKQLRDCVLPVDVLLPIVLHPRLRLAANWLEQRAVSSQLFLYIACCLLGFSFPHGSPLPGEALSAEAAAQRFSMRANILPPLLSSEVQHASAVVAALVHAPELWRVEGGGSGVRSSDVAAALTRIRMCAPNHFASVLRTGSAAEEEAVAVTAAPKSVQKLAVIPPRYGVAPAAAPRSAVGAPNTRSPALGGAPGSVSMGTPVLRGAAGSEPPLSPLSQSATGRAVRADLLAAVFSVSGVPAPPKSFITAGDLEPG